MSLFPAYESVSDKFVGGDNGEHNSNPLDKPCKASFSGPTEDNCWIENESYKIQTPNFPGRSTEPGNIGCNERLPSSISDEPQNSASSSDASVSKSSDNPAIIKNHNDRDRHHVKHKESKKKSRRRMRSRSRSRKREHSSESRSHSRSRGRSISRSNVSSSRSRSRSPFYSNRSSHSKRKKSKYKKYKKMHRQEHSTRRPDIPKFTPYKTFIEDFNIKDEDELRFAEDR